MNLDEFMMQLPGEEAVSDDDSDVSPEVQLVFQPSYPLIADINHIEIRESRDNRGFRKLHIFIHAEEAYEYYSDEDEPDS